MERKGEDTRTIMEGDFNTRTGTKRGEVKYMIEEGEDRVREFKDRKVNKERRILMKRIEELSWSI